MLISPLSLSLAHHPNLFNGEDLSKYTTITYSMYGPRAVQPPLAEGSSRLSAMDAAAPSRGKFAIIDPWMMELQKFKLISVPRDPIFTFFFFCYTFRGDQLCLRRFVYRILLRATQK